LGPLDAPEDAQGAALETGVLQHLIAVNEYRQLGYKVYYWRTSNKQEVDFVLYGKRGLIAIEVKSSSKFNMHQLAGLKAFGQDYPIAKKFLFYGGRQKLYIDSVEAWPVAEALKQITEIL
jgi:predicted AAA+ superfamily ATPase